MICWVFCFSCISVNAICVFELKFHLQVVPGVHILCVLWGSHATGRTWIEMFPEQPSAGLPWHLGGCSAAVEGWKLCHIEIKLNWFSVFVLLNQIPLIKGITPWHWAASPSSKHRTLQNRSLPNNFNGITDKWESLSIINVLVKVGNYTVFNKYIAEYLNGMSAKELSLRHGR